MITDRRLEKLSKVAAQRQEMTVILENVHDPHNIGAVMRSCDAVGIQEVHIVINDPRVRKWLELFFYDDMATCVQNVRKKYDTILATHINDESKSLYELDLTGKVALLFGNEHDGISADALQYIDGNYLIPQYGMVQSLNISVACAISIFEAGRQRANAGLYNEDIETASESNKRTFDHFINKHKESYLR
jgi:tRNA (guanosine-2'-O-)-methyltransferase